MSPSKNTIKVKIDTDENIDNPEKKPAKKPVKKPTKRKMASAKAKAKAPAKKVAKKPAKRKTAPKKPVNKQKITVIDEEEVPKEAEVKKEIVNIEKKSVKKEPVPTANLSESGDFVKKIIAEEEKAKAEKELKQLEGEPKTLEEVLEPNRENLKPIVKTNRSVAMYRHIAFSFIALTVVLVAVVAYFLLIKVTIAIIPNQERISNNIIFDVKGEEEIKSGGNIVPGLVEKNNFELEESYPASGENVVGKEAVGEVTITNNYNRNQPLVATTRLLAASGELFRLKNTVNVPAGEKITVDIYADDPSPEMAIAPTKFTVPGLWAGLQDKIYAESKETIKYQQKVEKYVLESDLENAVRDLKQKLLLSAKKDIESKYEKYKQVKYKIDENSIKTNLTAETDDEVNDFNASITADIVVVAFDEKIASDLAKQKFIATLSPNKEVVEFNDAEIIYALNNYDYLTKEATLNATFEGKVSIRDNAQVIDIEKIKGLTQPQLDTYLKQIKDIAGYKIDFSPSFLPSFLKRVPKLSDRIEVLIKKE